MERAHALNEQDDTSNKLNSHTAPQYEDEYEDVDNEVNSKIQEFKVSLYI